MCLVVIEKYVFNSRLFSSNFPNLCNIFCFIGLFLAILTIKSPIGAISG
jgi:hypothetical protein